MPTARNYQKELAAEGPHRVKDRAARNAARAKAMKEGTVSKGDGKVVNHKRPLSKGGSRKGSTTVQSAKASHSEGGKLQPKSGKAKGGRN